MTEAPKRDYEFKLQSHDDILDDLAAEVLSLVRAKAATPGEALNVLEVVVYMIIHHHGADMKNTLADFISNVLILQATNDIKGTA